MASRKLTWERVGHPVRQRPNHRCHWVLWGIQGSRADHGSMVGIGSSCPAAMTSSQSAMLRLESPRSTSSLNYRDGRSAPPKHNGTCALPCPRMLIVRDQHPNRSPSRPACIDDRALFVNLIAPSSRPFPLHIPPIHGLSI